MAVPRTPGEQRRHGLRRARWVAAGASVGAAAILTATVAAVNAAPSDSSKSSPETRSDDGGLRDDEFAPARPFTPQTVPQPTQQLTPQLGQPQTRSHGS